MSIFDGFGSQVYKSPFVEYVLDFLSNRRKQIQANCHQQ